MSEFWNKMICSNIKILQQKEYVEDVIEEKFKINGCFKKLVEC